MFDTFTGETGNRRVPSWKGIYGSLVNPTNVIKSEFFHGLIRFNSSIKTKKNNCLFFFIYSPTNNFIINNQKVTNLQRAQVQIGTMMELITTSLRKSSV